jgi:hypothetical protein
MENNVIILDMDTEREIKWTFGAIKVFEKRSKEVLTRQGIKNERGMPVSTMPLQAGAILDNYISIADILEAAVAAITGLSGLEGKKGEPSEASVAIDAYVGNGKSVEDLEDAICNAWGDYRGPSIAEEYKAARARMKERRRIAGEEGEAELAESRIALAARQAKIGGSVPTASPT